MNGTLDDVSELLSCTKCLCSDLVPEQCPSSARAVPEQCPSTNVNTPFFQEPTQNSGTVSAPPTLYSGTKVGVCILGTQCLNTAPFFAGAQALVLGTKCEHGPSVCIQTCDSCPWRKLGDYQYTFRIRGVRSEVGEEGGGHENLSPLSGWKCIRNFENVPFSVSVSSCGLGTFVN